ncbi:prohibitin family protein [Desulfovibrio sp.]|uniref:prohibitin family protein n=1 Tax=Desulfovibrio sp. TaxID=885 RepID=UPI0035AED111
MKSLWAAIRDKVRRNRIQLICGGLVTTLIILFLWPSIVISIKPGELGVLYARFRGGTQLQHTYEEGIHLIQPWNIMYIYDVRVQEETQNIDVLTVDGLTINVQISLRFQIIRDRLPALHQEIGPRYRDKVVLPIMNSAVRQTIGSYRPDDLYSTARQELQDQMLVDAVEEMGRIPILIQGFVVKTITLPEVLRDSIERKLVAEQSYLRYKYILLEEQQEARRKIIEAEGIKAYQMLVNEHMTQNFLRYQGIQATKDLASSPNAKVVVIGGKDGLPVILNADSPAGAAPADAATDKSADNKSTDKSAAQGTPTKPGQQTPKQDTGKQELVKPEPGKGIPPRPGATRSDAERPEEPWSGAVRQDPSVQQPAPQGVGWMAPGESVTDYIKRLDKSLLQPHRGGAVRQ